MEIKKMDKNIKIIMPVLIGSSVLMISTMFTLNWKAMGLGLLQFTVVVFFIIFRNVFDRVSAKELLNFLNQQTSDAKDNNRYFTVLLMGSAIPTIVLGLTTLLVMIMSMIFLFWKDSNLWA